MNKYLVSLLLISVASSQPNIQSETQLENQPEEFQRNELGLQLGWGNPYGSGFQYLGNISPSQAITAGAGFSMAGFKYGLGYNYYFNSENKFRPYLGTSVSRANGLSEVTVTVNQDSALYKIEPGTAIHPRVGLKIHGKQINLYFQAGYGITLSGGGSTYLEGSTKSVIKSFADISGVGGFELSAAGTLRF